MYRQIEEDINYCNKEFLNKRIRRILNLLRNIQFLKITLYLIQMCDY